MSTNYYIHDIHCTHCGNCTETHLGKASAGWKFILQANGFQHYKNWEEMKAWLKGKDIYDENDKGISNEEFFTKVENKQKDKLPDGIGVFIDGFCFYDGEFC